MADNPKQPVRVVNLGLHLLVSSQETDVVAICLHPIGISEAVASHEILEREGVAYIAPDRAIRRPDSSVASYRRLAYQAASEKCSGVQSLIAAELRVSEKTLRNWRRKGWV